MVLSIVPKTFGGDESPAEPDESRFDEDAVYDILANERRRVSLKCLADADGERPVNELSKEVAREIADENTSTDELYDSVYISLCQNHLPRLDDENIVDYNSDGQTVTLAPGFDSIERRWLEDNQTSTERWSMFLQLIGTSIVTLAFVGIALVGPQQFRELALPLVFVFHLLIVGSVVGTYLRS